MTHRGRLGSSLEEFFAELGELEELALMTQRKLLLMTLWHRVANFGTCLVCGKLFPVWELTNCHAASWECLACADETDRIMVDDEWWRVNGPKEDG